MNIQELAVKLELEPLVAPPSGIPAVEGCYIGDLLSWVMGRAKENDVWLTVMGNVNAIAVAKLADISGIVLCENAPLDEEARVQAEANGIAVYITSTPSYELALRIGALLS